MADDLLHLRVSPEAQNALNTLARKRGVNEAEVIRRALGRYLRLSEAQANGERVLLEKPRTLSVFGLFRITLPRFFERARHQIIIP